MMRELKFRAWDGSRMYIPHELIQLGGELKECGVLGKTILMQFTGLKDKNGKDIYEGDIVIVLSELAGYKKGTLVQVVWNVEKAAFVLEDFIVDKKCFVDKDEKQHVHIGVGNRWRLEQVYEFEVVGNVFENPELLKEVKE